MGRCCTEFDYYYFFDSELARLFKASSTDAQPVPRLDVKTFRVPGAAPIGRERVTRFQDVPLLATTEGALCVGAGELPTPLSAGG